MLEGTCALIGDRNKHDLHLDIVCISYKYAEHEESQEL